MMRNKRLTIAIIACGILSPSAVVRAEEPDAWIKRWQQNAPAEAPTPAASLRPRQIPRPAKKIPRSWKIAGISIAAVATALLLALSLRAWRAANVFGRRYGFRAVAEKPVRLGAKRCGGHIASAHFGTPRVP